ncbi:LysE family translocator [Thalassomonas sp. M1454]|uniref:LysE family translocator n=1 Tax=Thalassomonas sp. M1454 TaxID=2594477 RepID=UPI00117D8CBB|nr:LysE family translocator [Thalassomonas sp. M1454]TRX56954.1 LysE family translocator [Thalassomonas sp. M1454]
MDLTALAIFIPTFFFVSITPGLCMTLALTLGMTIGVRRTMWMMFGEVLGVALVAVSAVLGVAALMLKFPQIFAILKIIGALYLAYVGIQMWLSKGKMAITKNQETTQSVSRKSLFSQGFITAIANPKGWAFMISLLPPFINASLAITPQLFLLVSIIMISEFICMMIYATGGKTLGKLIAKSENVRLMNRISGTLMIGVSIWLAVT